ncbi:MAG TPA: sialidase family protein [Gemmatimonadaceae bacterium]|nr:sialidase family protein [Gemmatimonadaceae bacterium]
MLGSSCLGSLAMLAMVGACAASPVDWSNERSAATILSHPALRADGTLVSDTLAQLAARVEVPGPRCPSSLVLARGGSRLFAAWWTVRPDSSARLLVARSDDGGARWGAAVLVDTTDTSVSGCRRAPPSIAADSASGYVHVAYALRGREGPGLFFSHSMDAGGMFHEPVPIVYGERPGRTSVAADGDRVVVAFEDPNSTTPRIGLALSRTMGHIFEERILPVSSDNGAASRPLAAVRGRHIAVAWEQRATNDDAPAVLAIRAGTLH